MTTLLQTRRFTVTTGSGDTSVTPITATLRYRWETDGEGRFFRKKLNTRLLFKGTDYTFFKALYDAATCDETTILIEQLCGGVWGTEYEGRIIIASGEYDFDRCEVTYQVLPNDKYECFNKAIKQSVDFLTVSSAVKVQSIYGTIETVTCIYNGASFGTNSINLFLKDCWSGGTHDVTTGTTPDPALAWRPKEHEQLFDTPTAGQLQIVTTWARETATSVGSPPGSGWINISGTTWVRPFMYNTIEESRTATTYNFTATVADAEADNGRLFGEVVEAIVDDFNCGITGVRSNFFGINADATNPSNDAYDMAAAYFQECVLFQKSDVVRASADANAVRLLMTFEEFLTSLRNSLNVYWAIVPDGSDYYLYLEHWTYFDGQNGTDLTTLDGGKYIVGTNKFQAESEVPAAEIFNYQESFNDDFLGKEIRYPQACATSDETKDYSLSQMCADFGGLLDNSDAGLDGFVMVSAFSISGGNYLIDNTNYVANGIMSWRELFPTLWAFGRYGDDVSTTAGAMTVQSVRKRKVQTKITYKTCCDDGEFNPNELIQTGLGWGQVKDAEYDVQTNTITVNLLQQ